MSSQTPSTLLPPSEHSPVNRPVFFGASLVILLLVFYATVYKSKAGVEFEKLHSELMANASWFYVATVAVIFICVCYLGLSRYGDIKLGPDHAAPDYRFGSWFAMLFSAGLGTGLLFFGLGEPVMHFLNPPEGLPETVSAAREAMKITFFHWGLHVWSIYVIVALILAFFCYRHGLPLTLRSSLYPLIGDRIYGATGHVIDALAIIGTVCGIATALGYGVVQINAGLHYLFDLEVSPQVQALLIVAITLLSTLSAVSGLDRGIRFLSELNLLQAVVLLIMVMALGPTVLLLQMFVQNTGGYLSDIIYKTFNLYAYEPTDWIGGWTLFYWSWWLSWSPFVGVFIARISRGRTIREFVLGVLFAPSALIFLWMTAFGNTSIDLILHHGATDLANTVQQDMSLALFKFFEYMPLTELLSGIVILMVVIFFVTSSDSGAVVIDMMSSYGDDRTPLWRRVYWSFLIGVVALVLMLAGGLKTLQTVTIVTALPFAVLLLLGCYGLLKALKIDNTKKESQAQTTLTPKTGQQPIPWQARLANVVRFPHRGHVEHFMRNTVIAAMESVASVLQKQGVDSSISFDIETVSPNLMVLHGEEHDFIYKVVPRSYEQPSFMVDKESEELTKYFRAEVFLGEGGQDYDIMGWTREQVIDDVIDQYEKHMHFLHMVR